MRYMEKIQSFIEYLAETIFMFQVVPARAESLRKHKEDILAAEIRLVAHLLDKETVLNRKHTDKGNSLAIRLRELINALERKPHDKDESIFWAKDILNRYAKLVLREETSLEVLGVDELLPLIRTRRSVRRFMDQGISIEAIEKIIEAAKWAPSSCNRQPWRFIVIMNRNLIERIGSALFGGFGFAPQSTAIIVVLVDLRLYSLPGDRHLPYLDGAAAIMNMLLAIHSMGLGGCWINWKLKGDKKEVYRLLGIGKYMLPISAVVVGYPASVPLPPSRIRSDDLFKVL